MMKKLELIALLLSALHIEISVSVSLYTIISDAEHVLHDNRIPKKLQPVELMVDATNGLGANILDLHSRNNKNNIAFSPCGLMSVMVALYEGSAGKSAIELKEALNFPHERDIVRIGVRDIHRRLRSYFYRRENLLSGLIFNKENITIRPEYETVLRFYGYDLDAGTLSETTQVDANMTNTTEATDSTTPSTSTTALASNETTSGEDLTTTEPAEVETFAPTEVTNGDGEEEVTTVAASRKRRGQLGRRMKEKKQSVVPTKNSFIPRRSRSYYVLLDEDYENEFHLDLMSPSSVPISPIPSTTPLTQTIPTSTAGSHHHHHFLPTSTPHPPHASTLRASSVGKFRNNINKELFENTNSDSIEHIFYVNEYETVRVPYKLYDTVMKYSYVNTLQASFLEIDLDSEYYNLMIIVPDHHDGLPNLAHKLKSQGASAIRHIRNTMEYYWVKTIVPKFNLKGNTILTNDLQNMGINDIFEPTKADFSALADDKTLYVKNVEQMVNINIRTQSMQQLKKISSLYKRPIEVPVNIPFIYCVVDKKLDLIIILGRILNPLNSRIQ